MTKIKNIEGLFTEILWFMNGTVYLFIGVAFIYFLINLFNYIRKTNDPKAMQEAKGSMLFGIVILFVMLSVWGLVSILSNTIFGPADFGTMEIK